MADLPLCLTGMAPGRAIACSIGLLHLPHDVIHGLWLLGSCCMDSPALLDHLHTRDG